MASSHGWHIETSGLEFKLAQTGKSFNGMMLMPEFTIKVYSPAALFNNPAH
jgi:hypothetical protein